MPRQKDAGDSTQCNWIRDWKPNGGAEFLSDDHDAIRIAAKCDFEQLHLVDPLDDADSENQQPADDLESTQFAQLIAAAIERLNEPEPWGVLWLHSNVLRTRWDAPRWLADGEQIDRTESPEPLSEAEQLEMELEPGNPYGEDELPLIFEQINVPNLQLEADAHPDLIAMWMATYACQIRLIDDLLGVLFNAANAAVEDETQPLFLVTGTSGMSLGQNEWIGHSAGPMRSCQIQVPMVLSQIGPLRVPSLCSADSLPKLIGRLASKRLSVDVEDWCQSDSEFSPCLVSCGEDGSQSITSAKWFFVSEAMDVESASLRPSRLFLKPDDVDDVNDVSRLRTDVIDQFEDIASSQQE